MMQTNLDALEEFIKTKRKAYGTLKRNDNCYCLEGAACEVYRLLTGKGSWKKNAGHYYFELGSFRDRDVFPTAVRKFFGFKSGVAEINDEYIGSLTKTLKLAKDLGAV